MLESQLQLHASSLYQVKTQLDQVLAPHSAAQENTDDQTIQVDTRSQQHEIRKHFRDRADQILRISSQLLSAIHLCVG